LIINLSSGHTDIQKLIAFENAFERIFSIIETEGGVDGGIVTQDCLQLLNNLLSFNVSNQSYFRETGCVPRLARLFEFSQELVPFYAKEQRDRNIEYAMRVCRLFVVPGGLGAAANQVRRPRGGGYCDLFADGTWTVELVLQLWNFASDAGNCLFGVQRLSSSCRGDLAHLYTGNCQETDLFVACHQALRTVADLIHENSSLQTNFAQMKVQYLDPTVLPEVQIQQSNPDDLCYIIEGLLDLALLNPSIHAFDARLAACQCLESYFAGNQPVRLHFLNHAINLHANGDGDFSILVSVGFLEDCANEIMFRIRKRLDMLNKSRL
jgi:hypothetical protein